MLSYKQSEVGVLLLAAGEASRMGMPKQLLVYQQKPLIRHVLNELLALKLPVVVVLGARSKMIHAAVKDMPVSFVTNEDWQMGMGVSLKVGLRYFEQYQTQLKAILCCVVDQPYLSYSLLVDYLKLFNQAVDKKNILIAAKYKDGVIGVPALLGINYANIIRREEDSIGARKLLRRYKDRLHLIDFPEGDFDLDKQEDWMKFRKNKNL